MIICDNIRLNIKVKNTVDVIEVAEVWSTKLTLLVKNGEEMDRVILMILV